jgi:hypothetical protein
MADAKNFDDFFNRVKFALRNYAMELIFQLAASQKVDFGLQDQRANASALPPQHSLRRAA